MAASKLDLKYSSPFKSDSLKIYFIFTKRKYFPVQKTVYRCISPATEWNNNTSLMMLILSVFYYQLHHSLSRLFHLSFVILGILPRPRSLVSPSAYISFHRESSSLSAELDTIYTILYSVIPPERNFLYLVIYLILHVHRKERKTFLASRLPR